MAWISKRLCLGILLTAVLAIAGCSSSVTNPQGSSAAGAAEKGRSSTAGSASTGKSSLETLRAGEAPATPASSPLKEIYFDFDSYDLRPDERGTTEYNLALGAKRAQSAKDFLVNLGMPASRLSTISFGKEAQICRGHDEECWSKNRRDRFVGATRSQS